MTDREFLIWIHERLEHKYGESQAMDYMHKLRHIIEAYPRDKITINTLKYSSLEKLQKALEFLNRVS